MYRPRRRAGRAGGAGSSAPRARCAGGSAPGAGGAGGSAARARRAGGSASRARGASEGSASCAGGAGAWAPRAGGASEGSPSHLFRRSWIRWERGRGSCLEPPPFRGARAAPPALRTTSFEDTGDNGSRLAASPVCFETRVFFEVSAPRFSDAAVFETVRFARAKLRAGFAASRALFRNGSGDGSRRAASPVCFETRVFFEAPAPRVSDAAVLEMVRFTVAQLFSGFAASRALRRPALGSGAAGSSSGSGTSGSSFSAPESVVVRRLPPGLPRHRVSAARSRDAPKRRGGGSAGA